MDKFVQLPFVIPTPERKDLDIYIETLLINKEQSLTLDKKDNSITKEEMTKQSEPPNKSNFQTQD